MTRAELTRRLRRRVGRDPLLRAIREAAAGTGVELWLVGGTVRDTALGRPVEDVDLACGRPAARLIARLERDLGRRGFRFRRRGVTTWRFDVRGRRVDVVDAGWRGIERDLARRELTVNAIAFDLARNRILDPLRGLADLRAGLLRLPHQRVMREDPVRALRLARFLAQLPRFRPHRAAHAAAREIAGRLRRAAAERLREELDKLLVAADPVRGLEALERLELLPHALPELLPLRDCVAGEDRPDVWRHTLDAIGQSARPLRVPGRESLRQPGSLLVLRWSLLLHDIAKPETLGHKPDGRPTFHGHEELGGRRADAVLRRLRAPRELRRRVQRLVRFHLRPGHLADAGAPERGLRRLVREAAEDLPLLLVHAACDARASEARVARGRWARLRTALASLHRLYEATRGDSVKPLVDGRDVMERLGIPPGPRVGQLLADLEERQLEGTVRTREDALAYLDGVRASC